MTSNLRKTGSGREKALRRRIKDSGWGRSFAQCWVPFYAYSLYYAITRRTITPMIFGFTGKCIFFILLGVLNIDFKNNTYASFGAVGGLLATTTLATKYGQEKARKHAAKKLGIQLNK